MYGTGHGGGGDRVSERVERARERAAARRVRRPAVADRAARAPAARRAAARAPAPARRLLPARAAARPVPALLPRIHARPATVTAYRLCLHIYFKYYNPVKDIITFIIYVLSFTLHMY